MDMHPPTQDEYDKFDHAIFTSDVTWDPTVLDDETDLTMPNDNLIVNIDEEYYDARSLDTGEKSTQCIIAEMLWDHCKTNESLSLSILNCEDTLDFLTSEKFFMPMSMIPSRSWSLTTQRCRLVLAMPLLKLSRKCLKR